MNSLRRLIRFLIKESLLNEETIANIQPDDIVTVYHGASGTDLPIIRGIDATQIQPRSYGGPKHEGIFVSPESELVFVLSKKFGKDNERMSKLLFSMSERPDDLVRTLESIGWIRSAAK